MKKRIPQWFLRTRSPAALSAPPASEHAPWSGVNQTPSSPPPSGWRKWGSNLALKTASLAATVFLAAGLGNSQAATGSEALLNRGFESGTTPWVGAYWGGAFERIAGTPELPAHSGSYLMRLSGDVTDGFFTVTAQGIGAAGNGTFPIPAGAVMHAGAWFKVPDASPEKPCEVRVRPRCNSGVGLTIAAVLTTPDWTFVGDNGTGAGVTMPANDWLDFRLYGPDGGRDVYVDDCQCLVDAPALIGTLALGDAANPTGTTITLQDPFGVAIGSKVIDNPAGTYLFQVANGNYTVAASKFGYAANSASVTMAGADVSVQLITLAKIDVAAVSGKVTDGGSGVAGIVVRASRTANPSQFTESAPTVTDGSYSLLVEADNEYELSVTSGLPMGRIVATVPDPFTPADATPVTGKNITLGKGPLVYTFDAGTLQGWTDMGGGTHRVVSRTGGDMGAGQTLPNYAGIDNWDARDTSTSTLWLRSPAFVLDAEGDLTFWMAGGTGGGIGMLPANDAAVPTGQGATGNGFLGVALRDDTTGNFVLKASRSGSGGNWLQSVFTAAQLAEVTIPGREYTLDFIDTTSGGWGWICLDSISIPGAPGVPPVYTTISGTVADSGEGVAVHAGSLTGMTLSDGTYTITNAVVGRSYTLTLTSLPAGKVVDTAPAAFTAVETSNPNKNFTLKTDPDNDPNLLFSARSSAYTGSGNWATAYPLGAALNRLNTPGTTSINSQNWIVNQRGAGGDDGFELSGIPGVATGVDIAGASIVVAVRPVYPVGLGGEPRGEIVSLYYNGLVLAADHDTGEVMIARKAWDWRRTGYIMPNGQITVLSLVVQLDGACKLYANGVDVWTGAAIGTDSFARLQGTDTGWMTRIGVGRNPWDGWSSFNGNVGDVAVYKVALDDTKRAALETALMAKYGSSVNFTITASAGAGGTITPSGSVTVPQNSDKTFTVTPEKYFDVTSVLLDGATEVVTSPNAASYTLANVTANGSLAASFTEWSPTFITGKVALSTGTGVAGIAVTAAGGREPYKALSSDGSVDPLGTFSIRINPGVTYTVTATKPGWTITPASFTAGIGDLVNKNFVATYVGPKQLVHLTVSPGFTDDAPLTSWPNEGTLGGQFVADGGWDTVAPVTRASIGGKKAVEFNGNKMLLSSTASSNDKILAPGSITGPGSNFTVVAKLYDDGAGQNDPWEQFFLAWSRRNGPDGTCASFGYGKGWWGAIGGWGWGDTNYGALYPGTDRSVAPAWGQWNAVAMTSDGTTVTIYYNGVAVNTVAKTLNWHSNMPISLGSQFWGDNGEGRDIPFGGAMTELMIYDMALSAEEIAALSAFADPNDTDADGLPDAWEMSMVGNLTSLTRTGDFDRDGTSDNAEYRLGLIPNNGSSMFKVTIVRHPATGDVTLTWPSQMGLKFTVQWTQDLSMPNPWQDLATLTDTDGGTTETFTDTGIIGERTLFYRVALKP